VGKAGTEMAHFFPFHLHFCTLGLRD